MPSHADEGFLHEVLRAIGITRLSRDEVDQPVAIPGEEQLKRSVTATKMGRDQLFVREEIEGKCVAHAVLHRGFGEQFLIEAPEHGDASTKKQVAVNRPQ